MGYLWVISYLGSAPVNDKTSSPNAASAAMIAYCVERKLAYRASLIKHKFLPTLALFLHSLVG